MQTGPGGDRRLHGDGARAVYIVHGAEIVIDGHHGDRPPGVVISPVRHRRSPGRRLSQGPVIEANVNIGQPARRVVGPIRVGGRRGDRRPTRLSSTTWPPWRHGRRRTPPVRWKDAPPPRPLGSFFRGGTVSDLGSAVRGGTAVAEGPRPERRRSPARRDLRGDRGGPTAPTAGGPIASESDAWYGLRHRAGIKLLEEAGAKPAQPSPAKRWPARPRAGDRCRASRPSS